MDTLIKQIKENIRGKEEAIFSRVRARGGILVSGVSPVVQAVWTAATHEAGTPLLLVAPTMEKAQSLYENLRALLPEEQRIELFYGKDLSPFELETDDRQVTAGRVSILSRLTLGEPLTVIAPAAALSNRLIPPEDFLSFHLEIRNGMRYAPQELSGRLCEMGYERQKQVREPGGFSMRGGIVDIFPMNSSNPVRVDFFDDEIESIKVFNAETQLSEKDVSFVPLSPARENPFTEEQLSKAIETLSEELEQTMEKLPANPRRLLHERYSPLIEMMRSGIHEAGMEQLIPHLCPEAASLADYLPKATVILSEPEEIKKEWLSAADSRHSRYYDLLEAGRILPSFWDNFWTVGEIIERLSQEKTLLLCGLPGNGGFKISEQFGFMSRELPVYYNNPRLLQEDIEHFNKKGYRIFFAAGTELRLKRISELIREFKLSGIELLLCPLNGGFESNSLQMAVISEKELLGQESRKSLRVKSDPKRRIEHFSELSAGDHVVHINHGIGQYMGVERLSFGDTARDYLRIQYQGDDKLYLSVDHLEQIHKYIGNEGNAPRINKLSGGEWQRAKEKTKRAVKDIADELLRLYAEREQAQGFAFSPDTPWQSEFEDAFMYNETADQLQAAAEIKADMEKTKPMDRLLCGDVGYGKTEVALRAAFKAVMDGKQIAVLVPTTILAQQHFNTFTERFRGFPVKIGVISRFVSPAAQKKLLAELASGGVDIIIGTHRLLSKDVAYQNLGLLIIDEEQRFGVAHKEKIKQLKSNIDVLTLSATPIPRTLHMTLTGMRDMSVITTPPERRIAVQTYVLEYNEQLLKDAAGREIARGGQVFLLHNRVHDIKAVADTVSRLLPQAKVAVAHGQMSEKELEDVMSGFIEGRFDILVCTTIIESGLDIPNVNTLFVDGADTFGLSQLYQLRGRVGRSERQAFAYFTYRPQRILNETAKKRLLAIRDFTELGAGFKIAMRDMEIRGAGNLLGAEQHGNISAVGFDLYCQLIQEEIEQRRGEPQKKEIPPPLLELQINSFIPDSYIDDIELKLEVYQRIARATAPRYLDNLADELTDRYGKPPKAAENLLALGKIKILAQNLLISSVVQMNNESVPGCVININFANEHNITGDMLVQLSAAYGKKLLYSFKNKKDFIIKLRLPSRESAGIIDGITLLLTRLRDLSKQ